MKRLSVILAAMLLVFGLTQCKKEKTQNVAVGEKQHIVLSAGNGNDGSKVDVTISGAVLDLRWEADDEITVTGGAEGKLHLTSGAGETWATFEGDIVKQNDEDLVFTVGKEDVDYLNQEGTLEWVKDNICLEGKSEYRPEGDYEVNMSLTYALLKLDMSVFASSYVANNVNVKIGTVTKATITVPKTSSGLSETMYVAIPTDNLSTEENPNEVTYTFEGNSKSVDMTWKIKQNTYYTKKGSTTGESIKVMGVATIPVCAIHATCASSGGVVTGKGIEEQGVCWGTSPNPTIDGNKYIHQYAYSLEPLKLTPKNTLNSPTFTGLMSGLTSGTEYNVRAYIKVGTDVYYGANEVFITPSPEPFPTSDGSTVNFELEDYPNLEWSKYNLGVDPTNLDEAADWYGDYYMWGDNAACTGTTPGKMVKCNDKWAYRFNKGGGTEFTKYSNSPSDWYSDAGTPDYKMQLGIEDDCVSKILGETWRMPTGGEVNTETGAGEWQALYNGTLWVWTDHYDGIPNLKGCVVYKVKSTDHKKQYKLSDCDDGNGGFAGYPGYSYTLSDTHMFLPAAGYRTETSITQLGNKARYWSSSLSSSRQAYSLTVDKDSNKPDPQNCQNRWSGYSIRPVKK